MKNSYIFVKGDTIEGLLFSINEKLKQNYRPTGSTITEKYYVNDEKFYRYYQPMIYHNPDLLEKQEDIKPPLGITPRFIVEENRINEIFEAIMRFKINKQSVPREWIDELAELTK